MTCFTRTLYAVALCILVCTLSCVATREQFVNGQVYTSTVSPTMSVKVDDRLEYLGKSNGHENRSQPDFADNVRTELFTFAETKGNIIENALLFSSETLSYSNARWLQKGCQMLDGENYFYNDYIFEDMTKKCRLVGIANDEMITRYFGYTPSEAKDKTFKGFYLFEMLISVVNGNRTSFRTVYLEKIAVKGNSYWDTMDETMLSKEERKKFNSFLANSKTAFSPVASQSKTQ